MLFSVAHQVSGIDKVFVASFLPVCDVEGKPLAYYVIYHDDLSLKGFNRRYAADAVGNSKADPVLAA